jgi:hypothetical protein
MAQNDLSKDEVRELMKSYENAEVTNQLYEFGKTLLDEVQNRSARINSQSVAVLGWSTAILAFLFAGVGKYSENIGYAALCSAVLALLAMIFSINALRTRSDWSWPSDQSWIHQTALGKEDHLKRYHIRVMHDVRHGRITIVNAKANSVFRAELSLILAAMALVAGFGYRLLLAEIAWFVAFAKVI